MFQYSCSSKIATPIDAEIMISYSGWKDYLLNKNADVIDKNQTEEVFYLMMLMLERKTA